VESDAATLGKRTGKDAVRQGTLVGSLVSMARRELDRLVNEAISGSTRPAGAKATCARDGALCGDAEDLTVPTSEAAPKTSNQLQSGRSSTLVRQLYTRSVERGEAVSDRVLPHGSGAARWVAVRFPQSNAHTPRDDKHFVCRHSRHPHFFDEHHRVWRAAREIVDEHVRHR